VRDLPTGTVTFLFTDIEGSTRLLHEQGDRYAELLAEHRRILRDAFARHDGVEVDTQGDAFFVAFARASDALTAARDGQAALDGGPIRVRMGLHTGEPTVTDEGYVGVDVHRAARIAAAGHGGQVLVSQTTRGIADPGGLRDLGEFRLKDLSAPERLYQLGDGEFPPLKTLYATNLPIPVTPFVGREQELAEVSSLIARSEVRLLTLTGPGGSGKTRLALQAVAAAAEEYPHGVWWVPLAAISDAAAVLPAVAMTFGSGAPPAETIGDRRLLLLLDNFEHVIETAADVAALLRTCPRLDIVLTSRERLRVRGEHVYPVPVLARAEARDLFVMRARASSSAFRPDERVDDLCARLEDLPLAIELAAARTSLLTTEQLLGRLGNRLDVLRGGRDEEARQQTLRATIEWSYDLLTAEEKRLLAALSIFRGGWTLTAAERVCDSDVDLLESLADKSLVRRWDDNRFGMLETIREFSAEQLAPTERAALMQRLLQQLIELAESANLYEEAKGGQRPQLVSPERANIETVLAWALEDGEINLGLQLIWLLELFISTSDPVGGRRWIEAFLERAGGGIDPGLRARAVRVRGSTYDMSGQHDLAERDYERARELFSEVGEDESGAHLANRIAMAVLQQGDTERAGRLGAEALDLDRQSGHRRDEAVALSVLGNVALAQGDRDEGVRLMFESAALAESVGFDWWRGVTLGSLAEWLVEAGELDEAERALVPAAEAIMAAHDRVNIPFTLAMVARIAAARGDAYRAGTFWGAVEAVEEREPTPAWTKQRRPYEDAMGAVAGPEFDRGRERGLTLTPSQALDAVRAPID
jgi:predicted ATPase